MPPAVNSNSIHLAIEVANIGYDPGSPIVGKITRRAAVVAPEAELTLRLFGRTKVKLVRRHNNNTHYYRSQYQFFQTNAQDVVQLLHQGPLHIDSSSGVGQTWQFALDVPTVTGIDPRALRDNESSYLLNGAGAAGTDAAGALPPSFHSMRPECYVEYYLEARLAYQHKGKWNKDVAHFPIHVHATPVPSPITDWKLQRRTERKSVTSYHLAPGMESAGLSLKQKGKQFFHTSSVPKLDYSVELITPSVLQLDHPGNFPLTLRFVPNRDTTSPVLHDVPFHVTLTAIRMKFRIEVSAQAPGNLFGMKSDSGTESGDLLLHNVFGGLDEPITLPVVEGTDAVDFGAEFQLQVRDEGLYSNDRHLGISYARIRPTFVTHNIIMSQVFKYQILYKILDKAEEIKFEVPTMVLPRAATMNEPPPPFVAPPPFTDVAKSTEAGPSKVAPPTFEEAIAEAGPSSSVGASDSKKAVPESKPKLDM